MSSSERTKIEEENSNGSEVANDETCSDSDTIITMYKDGCDLFKKSSYLLSHSYDDATAGQANFLEIGGVVVSLKNR